MVCVIVRKLKDSYEERKAHELKMKNNMPFRADEYRAMLSRMYPHRNWKRTQFCTNFLTRSPVVVGKFSPVIIIPERKYSEFQIQVILMHEGMHIVRLDNLAKQISSVLIYINWFNPVRSIYTIAFDINIYPTKWDRVENHHKPVHRIYHPNCTGFLCDPCQQLA